MDTSEFETDWMLEMSERFVDLAEASGLPAIAEILWSVVSETQCAAVIFWDDEQCEVTEVFGPREVLPHLVLKAVRQAVAMASN